MRCGTSWRGKNKVWLWRAYDPVARRTLAWELGGRDDATCQRLLDRVGIEGHVFLTDDWEGFHRLIPQEQLFTGKDLTFPIEQDNSNIRHYLARFRRRSKVTSRALHMVDSSLRLLHHLMRPENFLAYRDTFLSIFA
jgi:insertion element IS1 protein InsB